MKVSSIESIVRALNDASVPVLVVGGSRTIRTGRPGASSTTIAPACAAAKSNGSTLLAMKRAAGRPQDQADIAELTGIHGGTDA
jgi:hypothetical protein